MKVSYNWEWQDIFEKCKLQTLICLQKTMIIFYKCFDGGHIIIIYLSSQELVEAILSPSRKKLNRQKTKQVQLHQTNAKAP
jgi:hypothetical protein